MFEIGSTFRQQLANDNRSYAIQLNFTFPDASTLTVENDAIWEGGFKIEDAVSSDNEFQIGSAIVNKLSVTLNNIYDDFSEYDFDGAVVVAYIGININGSASEYFRRGTYIVQNSDGYNTSLIKLECYDYMTKFDVPYAMVNTTYPATLRTIVQNICTTCSVTLLNTSFYNWNFTVQKRPDSEGLTCRQMLAFVAQLAGSYARCDEYGRLDFGWYDMASTPVHSFAGIYNISTGMDAILITGVRVTEEFAENEQNKKNTILYGNEGYVLEISGNDLIQQGDAQTVAEAIGRRVVNAIPFYKVNATILSDPSVEVGDVATITDNKGNTVMFPITSVTFETDNSMAVACGAQDAVRHSTTQYSELTRALVKAKQISQAQISSYDLAMQTLTELMSEAFGVFKTEEVQQDGSSIYILHNKPTLESSNIQWKMTANGLAVSSDYGQTWVAGIDSSGNAVVNVLNAIGVNADWINAGRLAVEDGNGNYVFIADIDTGSVYVSGDNVFIGNQSATDALAQLSGALTVTLSNEIQGIPVDSHGDYGVFPNASTQIRVLYGSQDVTQTCTLTYSVFNITGTLALDSNLGCYVYSATGLSGDTGYVTFTASYNTGTETLRNSKRFDLYKVYAGADGAPGQGIPARTYFIEPDAIVIKQGQDKEYIPGTITFNAYYRDGNETARHAYTGLFRVEVTTDGSTWETVEYPVENKTYTTYTPTDDDIAGVRCTLYSLADIDTTYFGLSTNYDADTILIDDDGALFYAAQDDVIISGGDELDLQSLAVVVDVSALSQEEVYNILTNNSQNEGVYLSNGHLYLNATRMGLGVLQSQDNSSYWDLETGELVLNAGAKVGVNGETLGNMRTRITTNANSISSEATARGNADTALSSRITQNASDITLKVSKNTQYGTSSAHFKLTDSAITWAATNSSLTADGTLTARNANFTGSITGGSTININNKFLVGNTGDATVAGSLTVTGSIRSPSRSGSGSSYGYGGVYITGPDIQFFDASSNQIGAYTSENNNQESVDSPAKYNASYWGMVVNSTNFIKFRAHGRTVMGLQASNGYGPQVFPYFQNIVMFYSTRVVGAVLATEFLPQSDERKKNILEWDDRIEDFVLEIDPILYTWKSADDTKAIHAGMGAQRTKALLEKHGIDNSGLVHYDSVADEYSVSYMELAPMMLPTLQANRRRIEELEEQVKIYKNRVELLEAKVEMLMEMLSERT